MTLSDTHLVILSTAAQHRQHLLQRPETMADRAAAQLTGKLTKAGLVEQVRVKRNQPHWSVDDADNPVGLRITAAGLVAIGVGEEGTAPAPAELAAAVPGEAAAESADPAAEAASPPGAAPPGFRPGSKQALLVTMLSQDGGGTVDALMAGTGWLPHTVRAALTGLRKKGYSLGKERDGEGAKHYRLATPAAAAEPAPDTAAPAAEQAE